MILLIAGSLLSITLAASLYRLHRDQEPDALIGWVVTVAALLMNL